MAVVTAVTDILYDRALIETVKDPMGIDGKVR